MSVGETVPARSVFTWSSTLGIWEAFMSKTSKDVVHQAGQLERYLQQFLDREGITFEQWMMRFGEGSYLQRNEVILRMLRPFDPRKIFEFACAGGFLAKLLLDNIDTVEQYTCSNFSIQVLEYSAKQLCQYPKCSVKIVDADVKRADHIERENVNQYDTIVTTSFEHIQYDRELIEMFPSDCIFVFSVAGFDDPEHFRHFESEEQIRGRYADVLKIISIERVGADSRFVVIGRVRVRKSKGVTLIWRIYSIIRCKVSLPVWPGRDGGARSGDGI
jgi:hypothetical protein